MAKKKRNTAKDSILRSIDDASAPHEMSLEEAKDFLEDLHMEIQCRLDGITDDLRMRE